jgi:signal transduction histidine kinase
LDNKTAKVRSELIRRLESMTLSRAIFTGVASFLATSAMLVLVDLNGGIDPLFQAAAIANITLNIARIVFGFALISEPSRAAQSSWASGYRWLSHLINGLWCVAAHGVYQRFGTDAQVTFLVLLITCAMISSAEFAYATMIDLCLGTMVLLGLATTFSMAILGHTAVDYAISSLGVVFALFTAFNAWQTNKVMLRGQKDLMEKSDKNELMRSMMNATPGFMTLIDAEKLSYVMVNDDFRNSIGLDVIGTTVGTVEKDQDFYDLLLSFRDSDSRKNIREMELGAGEHRAPYLVSLAKINGPRPLIAVLSLNISEQKKTELALAKARSDAEHSGRLAALGEMISSLAHEIRNPLTIISARAMNLPILAGKEPINATQAGVEGRKISDMVDRISKIIGTVLKFSRGETDAPMVMVKLGSMIEEVRLLTDIKCKAGNVEMRINIGDPDVEFECQQLQLSQVLINMVNNAVDAIEKRSPKWIEITASASAQTVVFRITDCGPGIPEDVREKMLTPFFTTKPPGKGTGLGLSISRSIIEKHAGKLWIDADAPNTTFVIDVPRKQAVSDVTKKAS